MFGYFSGLRLLVHPRFDLQLGSNDVLREVLSPFREPVRLKSALVSELDTASSPTSITEATGYAFDSQLDDRRLVRLRDLPLDHSKRVASFRLLLGSTADFSSQAAYHIPS